MNSNYDQIDNLFFQYFNNNQKVPYIVTNRIKTTMSSKSSKNQIFELIKKIIITIIGILTITGGLVFAQDIKNIFQNLIENIFGNYNNGISTAVQNGYIENMDMDYIESNNIKVKIDQLTLDTYNLGIVFNIKLDEKFSLPSDLYTISLKNVFIIDENRNIIFAEYENQNQFIEYCQKNNLYEGKYGIGYANSPANGKILKKEDNNIIYSLYTTSENFPISKKLTINFDKIALVNNKIEEVTTFTGKWQINLDLQKIQEERKTIEYSVKNINDNKTTVEKASVSMSNMQLEIITSSNKIDFNKLQNRDGLNVTDMLPFHDIYIETSNGKKFFESNSANNGYTSIDDNKIKFYTTLDYTYFDKTETIKIVLPTNKKEDLIIEMKANRVEDNI